MAERISDPTSGGNDMDWAPVDAVSSFSFSGRTGGALAIVEGFGSGVMISDRPCIMQFFCDWTGSLTQYFARCDPRNGTEMLQTLQAELQECLNHGRLDGSSDRALVEARLGPALRALFSEGNYVAEFFPSVDRQTASPENTRFRYTVYFGPPEMQRQYEEEERAKRPAYFGQYDLHPTAPVLLWDYGCITDGHITQIVLEDYSTVILTQPDSELDSNRVELYRSMIHRGIRPILFAVRTAAGDRVLLDGHHKFRAYESFPAMEPAWLLVRLHVSKESQVSIQVNGTLIPSHLLLESPRQTEEGTTLSFGNVSVSQDYLSRLSRTHHPLEAERRFLRTDCARACYDTCLADAKKFTA